MLTTKWNARLLRTTLAFVCAGLVLAACGNSGSLADGTQYMSEGKYRSAYIEAKKILQAKPKSGDAWLLLGKATLMMGNPKDALTDLDNAKTNGVPASRYAVPMARALLVTHGYDKILALPDGTAFKTKDDQVAMAVVRGDAYRATQKATEARAAYAAALKIDPNNARALVGMSALAAVGGDLVSAHKLVQQAVKLAPKSPDGWVAKGNMAFAEANYSASETDYQKALDLDARGWLPQDRFAAQLKLAEVQARQKQYDKALVNLKALEKMAPQMPQPHYLHALILFNQGHLDDAVSQLQLVLKAVPDNVPAQFLMGQVNYAKGNYGQAQMYLSNVLGMDPKNATARKLLALSYYREGSSSRALTTLKPVLPGKPTNTQMLALMQRAVARGAALPHTQTGIGTGAVPAVASSSPLVKQFAGVRTALAGGDSATAIQLLNAMPESTGPAAVQHSGLLVMAYVRGGQAGEAVKSAAAWVAKHPKDVSAHLLYGTALVADGKRDKARAEYAQAAKLNPSNLAALMNLGSLDVMEGKYKDAEGHFAAILQRSPGNPAAMLALGKLAEAQGKQFEAIKWFNQVIAAAPKAPEAYLRLITLYSRGGRFGEAIGTGKKLVAAEPGNALALNALGAAELSAAHPDKALQSLQQAVQKSPDVATYRINLARAQILTKDNSNARANLEHVVKANPAEVQAVGMLAFMHLHAGDVPGAIKLAKTLQSSDKTQQVGDTLEGDLYMAVRDFPKAADAYTRGLQAGRTRTLVLKHFQALMAGNAPHAQQGLEKWLAKHESDASMRMVLAQYYLNHSRPQLASREYRRLLKAYPSNVIVLNNLAWLYTTEHNPNAVAMAKKAYTLAPKAVNVADTYAWALLSNHQAKAALPILEKAVKQAPNAPTIHYHLALAQSRTGDNAAARATLEALAKTNTNYPERAAAAALYKKLGGAASGK